MATANDLDNFTLSDEDKEWLRNLATPPLDPSKARELAEEFIELQGETASDDLDVQVSQERAISTVVKFLTED